MKKLKDIFFKYRYSSKEWGICSTEYTYYDLNGKKVPTIGNKPGFFLEHVVHQNEIVEIYDRKSIFSFTWKEYERKVVDINRSDTWYLRDIKFVPINDTEQDINRHTIKVYNNRYCFYDNVLYKIDGPPFFIQEDKDEIGR